VECLTRWLHISSTLTYEQMMTYLNRENLRLLLTKLELSTDLLTDAERKEDSPLDVKRWLNWLAYNARQTLDEYRRDEIKSKSTIMNFLHGMVYTRKNVVREKETVNNPSGMAARLKYSNCVARVAEYREKFLRVH
jgi:hypothetical protein